MRYLLSCISFLYFSVVLAQNIDANALDPVLEDIRQFSDKYYSPGSEAVMYAMSSAWFNTAQVNGRWKLDVGLVGNITFADSDSRQFLFDETDYNNTRLLSGQTQQNVSTILGENDPDISVFVSVVNPEGGDNIDVELKLPNGLAKSVSFIPTGFFQAGLGLGHGFEIKARYLPNFNYKDIDAQFFGFGLQNEITQWLKTPDNFPLHISALIGYTNFDGFYGFTTSDKIDDLDGRISTKSESWLFSAITSTTFKSLNFYGSIGFISGTAETTTSMTGVYTLEQETDSLDVNIDIKPYNVKSSVNGVRFTIGANLKLGAFNLYTDFSLQKFSSANLGMRYNVN